MIRAIAPKPQKRYTKFQTFPKTIKPRLIQATTATATAPNEGQKQESRRRSEQIASEARQETDRKPSGNA
ncbi:MAG: hypothetical protein HC795_09520 [Coleofasciculaceae cyanobacterium RL_1_1]|nr:hypothetical protein [Coleofasciculaceae cyanobacterium RL_1_1]